MTTAAALDAYLESAVRPHAAAMAAGEGPTPRQVLEAAAAHGLAGLLVPGRWGGSGASHAEFASVIKAVAAVCASTSVILDVHLSVACEPILLFGTDEQRDRYLPRLASGEWLGGFALTEPEGGSDAAALSTRATRTAAGDYRLRGTKAFITNGGAADLYIVVARTGTDRSDTAAFLVEAGWAGVRPGGRLHKMGLGGSWTGELHLDDVEVPEANRLGEPGMGFRIAMAALDSGRVGISAQASGIAEACVGLAVAAGAAERDEARLADMAARAAASWRLTDDAARFIDGGESVTGLAAIAKLYATDAAMACAEAAVDFSAEAAPELRAAAEVRFRDAKACQIYEGTNQIQRIVIARRLLRGHLV